VPAARQYECQADQYWVFGPFCRPCCALGYICENDSTSRQLAPTVELLRRFFGMHEPYVAPPRGAHMRFGGFLGDSDFYGTSGYTALKTLQPPFVTFANYVVGIHGGDAIALLPQSAGSLIDLERPKERTAPLAEKKPTGRSPLFLEFLAGLKNTKDLKDESEAIELKNAKKRKSTEEAPNFLKQFVKPKA